MIVGPRFAVWRAAAGATPAPVLSSVDFDLFDVAGGESITITGTGLGSATLCTVGGTSCTITANTPTSLTFTTPAKTAGSYNLQVTTAGGASNTISLEAWSPASISGIDSYFDSRKGVSVSGSDVTTWTEQTRSAAYTSVASQRPTRVLAVFGSQPAIRFAKPGTTNDAQWVKGTRRGLTNKSIFWVGKYTSSDASQVYDGNAPLTLVGDTTGSIVTSCGLSAGVLRNMQFNPSVWVTTDRGSGLNDGNARLMGWTHASGGDLKAYVGTTQQGATATVTFNASNGYDVIGGGYKDNTNADDGYAGDIGAVVIVDGVVSGGDLTKLHKWSRVGFGAAA